MTIELAAMPALVPLVPLGRVQLSDHDPNPRATHGPISSAVLASTAAQLDLVPWELEAHAEHLGGRR